MPIDQINFDKLRSSSGKSTKSFEQLAYQLMINEYGHLGSFTAIDGSGGDGGVEFYLDLENGERWGCQCKYFEDQGRLNVSNRYSKIENSLVTACSNHVNLTKWFLCLKTNLTVDNISSTKRLRRGERTWFNNTLKNKIPDGRNVKIDFIGEEQIIGLLAKIGNLGIKSFFFGELEVDQNWFEKNFYALSARARDKYEPELHTLNQFQKSIIDYVLMDQDYVAFLEETKITLKLLNNEFSKSLNEFKSDSVYQESDRFFKEEIITAFAEHESHVENIFEILRLLQSYIENYEPVNLQNFDVSVLLGCIGSYLNELRGKIGERDDHLAKNAMTVFYKSKKLINEFERYCRNYLHELESALHFLGDAAVGKTHLSCDIAYKRIAQGLPAIFLTGDKFTNEANLEQTLLKLLDIPGNYSMDVFLDTLNTFGSIVKAKIPLIIDGLNETTSATLFSKIWHNHLISFAAKLQNFKNIVLITTCRTTYANEIWEQTNGKNFHILSGFSGHEVTKEAVVKYFNRYNIRCDLSFTYLDQFSKPIFLKLYCEIKNPNWRNGTEVEVNIEADSTDDIFAAYFDQVNDRVTKTSQVLRKNEPFISTSMTKIGAYLWENNIREIPIDSFYKLIDGDVGYDRQTSKADLLINEGLVIARDMRQGQEYISLTYEIMAGFIVAKHLIGCYELTFFSPGGSFHRKMAIESEQHPLHENIISEISLLFPKVTGRMLHDIYDAHADEYIFSISTTSMWSLAGHYLRQTDIMLINELFLKSDENKNTIFELCIQTITDTKHPFNATFLSNLLSGLEVAQRDLSWTEYVRSNTVELISFLGEFENQCKYLIPDSTILESKLHLAAEFIQWFLLSTNRELRDLTTRALFYYGRRFPEEYVEITIRSLQCHDPYLWERTLASLYGICLAEHSTSKLTHDLLAKLGMELFALMFKKQAPFFTTHILARDYARGIIRVCLLYHPDLLSQSEIQRIHPPYSDGRKKNFPVFHSGGKTDGPVYMDFSNYTIGTIVKDGHSYSNPPEKIKVRGQIYHRIYQLGWQEQLFADAERQISNSDYSARTDRKKIERYGKKYSWIAFHEVAGHRADKGLLKDDWEEYRLSMSDIDPSFPEEKPSEKFVWEDFLGDRSVPLLDWLKTQDFPPVNPYLEKNFPESEDQWICLDGYVGQADPESMRKRFTFIRSLLIKDHDFVEAISLLKCQHFGGRWLPEKISNYHTFAGELYLFNESTHDNHVELSFVIGKEKRVTRKGEKDYYADFKWRDQDNMFAMHFDEPDEIEREFDVTKKFTILLPAMVYHWENDSIEINTVGSVSVLAKEIARELKLIPQGQSFEFLCQNGKTAVKRVQYYGDFNDSHNFTYLRKDLLEQYLEKTNQKMVWTIWGEREAHLKLGEGHEFFAANGITENFVFQRTIEYIPGEKNSNQDI